MEERRTNNHGLGLALSVRRGKFWHFSGILAIASVYPNEIPTQLPGTLTHPLSLADLFQQPPLSDRRLSLTVANPSSVDGSVTLPFLVFFCSRRKSRTQALCVGFAPKQSYPLTGAHSHPHPQNECSP